MTKEGNRFPATPGMDRAVRRASHALELAAETSANIAAAVARDKARRAALVELLRELEWSASVDMEAGGYEPGCAICGAAGTIGHNLGCRLAAALEQEVAHG